jgi:antitoxin ParD1/3/4
MGGVVKGFLPNRPHACHLLTLLRASGIIASMASSLHVSLPDDMRAYVDLRSSGTHDFATPSEYVRALIRKDMENEAERRYVLGELLKSADDMRSQNTRSAAEVQANSHAFLQRFA